MTNSAERPLLRIVRGTPDDEELAAVAAVVAGLAAAGEPDQDTPAPPSRWADRASMVRRPLPTGPGAWRASVFPG
jgi:hypothetical protein